MKNFINKEANPRKIKNQNYNDQVKQEWKNK